MDAASCGAADIVSDLLAARAKTDLLSKDGQTALIISVGRNDVAVTGQLLAAGADADIKDKLGISARKYASLFHNPQIAELFERLSPA
jgi:ankyrin repeat protein